MKHKHSPIDTVEHDELLRWMIILAGALFLVLLISRMAWEIMFPPIGGGPLDVSSYIALTLVILLMELYFYMRLSVSNDEGV